MSKEVHSYYFFNFDNGVARYDRSSICIAFYSCSYQSRSYRDKFYFKLNVSSFKNIRVENYEQFLFF